MVKLKLQVGRGELTYECNDVKEAHKFSEIYGSLPKKCNACENDDVRLYHKNIKDNDYYGIKCNACGATLDLHQKKIGGFYVKYGEKMTVYQPGNQMPHGNTVDDSDIPF